MLTEIADVATTVPTYPGDAPRPRRNGARSMIPLSWLGRSARLEYEAAGGLRVETSATLQDFCGLGLIVNSRGARTIISWDAVRLVELAGD